MDLFMELVTYFGIPLISEAETFPQLLQAFFYGVFAVFIVYSMFALVMDFSWKIEHSFLK